MALLLLLTCTFLNFTLRNYSITDIDVSKSEPVCVRQCSANYSSCVSQGNQIGFKTETLRACRESYAVCVQTCPTK